MLLSFFDSYFPSLDTDIHFSISKGLIRTSDLRKLNCINALFMENKHTNTYFEKVGLYWIFFYLFCYSCNDSIFTE